MLRAGQGTGRRWAVVAALVGVLLALPPVVALRPASDADVGAAELRAAVLASEELRYSGYAESAGGLVLPVGVRAFSEVVDLFSDRTQMRVWWRGAADHRVDVVDAGGETGYHRDGAGTWVWEYEDARATRLRPAAFALPTAPDLLPSSLGHRLLSETTDDELSRIGARRVSGREALGLRITPSEPASSVDRVDVWVDRDSGLPLQVEVFGGDSPLAALDTRFLDLDLTAPDASVTAFVPPAGARVTDHVHDVLERADEALTRVRLPDELAGLPRRDLPGAPAAVGVYGRGVTFLTVVPVRGRLARELARNLRGSPDAVPGPRSLRVGAGPLGLAAIDPPERGGFVVTGTVTLDALAEAAAALGLEG